MDFTSFWFWCLSSVWISWIFWYPNGSSLKLFFFVDATICTRYPEDIRFLQKHDLKAEMICLPIGITGSFFITKMRYTIYVDWKIIWSNYCMGYSLGAFPCSLLWWDIWCFVYNIAKSLKSNNRFAHHEHEISFLAWVHRACLGDHQNRFWIFWSQNRLYLFDRGCTFLKHALVHFSFSIASIALMEQVIDSLVKSHQR